MFEILCGQDGHSKEGATAGSKSEIECSENKYHTYVLDLIMERAKWGCDVDLNGYRLVS